MTGLADGRRRGIARTAPGPTSNGAPVRTFLAPSDSRLWRILGLLRRGVPEASIQAVTGIAPVVRRRARARGGPGGARCSGPAAPDRPGRRMRRWTLLATAKRAGFGDRELAELAGRQRRASCGRRGSRSGSCRATRWSTRAPRSSRPRRPYFYSTYAAAGSAPEAPPVPRPAALVIGSGPVRIGQGIEFDYCAVQAADTLRARLVGRDDQLEPRDRVDRLRRIVPALLRAARRRIGALRDRRRVARVGDLLPAMVQFGGQTPLNLAAPLADGGVPLLGADLEAIDQAEERTRFAALLDRLGIPQPEGGMAHSVEEALTLAERIGYPVIVRPSFVIGGLAIDFSLLAGRPRSPARGGDRRRPGPAGPDRPLPRGRRGGRGRGVRRRRRS